MTLIYTAKLGLKPKPTYIGNQKIDGLVVKTYSMISASFSLQDSLEKIQFLEKTFLLAITSMGMALKMPFFSLSNTNFQFYIRKLT